MLCPHRQEWKGPKMSLVKLLPEIAVENKRQWVANPGDEVHLSRLISMKERGKSGEEYYHWEDTQKREPCCLRGESSTFPHTRQLLRCY